MATLNEKQAKLREDGLPQATSVADLLTARADFRRVAARPL